MKIYKFVSIKMQGFAQTGQDFDKTVFTAFEIYCTMNPVEQQAAGNCREKVEIDQKDQTQNGSMAAYMIKQIIVAAQAQP